MAPSSLGVEGMAIVAGEDRIGSEEWSRDSVVDNIDLLDKVQHEGEGNLEVVKIGAIESRALGERVGSKFVVVVGILGDVGLGRSAD